jgi:hypothetical protein
MGDGKYKEPAVFIATARTAKGNYGCEDCGESIDKETWYTGSGSGPATARSLIGELAAV